MAITYSRAHGTWVNDEAGGTEADADAFNTLDAGIDAIYKLPNAAGELVYGSAADTLERLAAGTSTQLLHGGTTPSWSQVVNADVAAAAAIAYSKLNLALGIVNADISASAAISPTKIASGPSFSAFRNTSVQAITTATFVKVQLNGEEFDTGSLFDSVTNFRFLPTTAGYYQFSWGAQLASLKDTGNLLSTLYKNGSEFKRGSQIAQGAAQDAGSVGSALVSLNGSTDYVELFVRHDHGSDRNVLNGAHLTYLTGAFIGPT